MASGQQDVIEMPALGRKEFTVGSLYDCRTEILSDKKPWKEDELKNKWLQVVPTSDTTFTFTASNKKSEKLNKLNLNGSMKLSLLGGLIQASGSASYLNSDSSSSEEHSVHVHCKILTVTKSLTMQHHLAPGKVTYLDLAKTGAENQATHVVSKIQYGAGATFTLKVKKSESKNEADIKGKLKIAAETLMKGLGKVQGSADGGCQERDGNAAAEFQCELKCDVMLPSSVAIPTTFEEALNFAKRFRGTIQDAMDKDKDDGSPLLGVPQRVWLTPLKHLPDVETAPVLTPLSIDNVANDFVRFMDELDELTAKANSLIQDPLTDKLKVFKDKIITFLEQLNLHNLKMQRKLKETLVRLRSSKVTSVDDGISLLEQLHQEWKSAPFELNRLSTWIDDKDFELCRVKAFLEKLSQPGDQCSKAPDASSDKKSAMAVSKKEVSIPPSKKEINPASSDGKSGADVSEKEVLIFPSQKEINRQITSASGRTSIHFVFTSLADREPLLDAMTTTDGVFSSIDSQESWARRSGMYEFLEELIEKLNFLNEVNRENGEMAFAVTFLGEPDADVTPGATVRVYQNGNLEQTIYKTDCYNDATVRQEMHKKYLIYCKNKIAFQKILRQFVIPQDRADAINWDPLLAVCRFYQHGNLPQIVKLLIECHAADVKAKTWDDWNALLLVCHYYSGANLVEIIRLFVDKEIDVNSKNNHNCNALLIVCRLYSGANLIEIIRFFIDKGIDVNAKTDDNWNALHRVCRYYSGGDLIDIIRLFVGKGIDVNAKTDDNWNALLIVCRYYSGANLIDIIRLFVDKGIDVNARDNDNWNALHFVCRFYSGGDLIDIIRLFIDKKIDVNAKTLRGNTALALFKGNYKGPKANLDVGIQLLSGKF